MHYGMHNILSWRITLTKFSKNIYYRGPCKSIPNPFKKNQCEKKTIMLISREENFGNPKRMATDGLDSGLGSEMGLTCKHEFQTGLVWLLWRFDLHSK